MATAVEQLRIQRRAERDATGYQGSFTTDNTPDPATSPVPISENESARQLTQTSFGNRVASDVAGLAYGVPIAAATLVTHPIDFAKSMVSGLYDTGKNLLGVTGVLGQKQASQSRTYYSAHPVLAALDALSIASFGAGSALKTAVTSSAKSATEAAIVAATKAGIKEDVVRAAFETTRSVVNPERYVRGYVKPQSAIMTSLNKAVKTGDVKAYAETITARLMKSGVDAENAVKIAQAAATDVAQSISRNSTRLKVLDSITHPLSASVRVAGSGVQRVGEIAFGKAPESALGRFFDKGLLEKNKKTAVGLERWLGAVVDERGWDQTPDNRFRVLQEIRDDGDFAGLSQEQLLTDFSRYVDADTSRAKLGLDNQYVLVKNLPEHTANAMADTVKENIERIKNEVTESEPNISASEQVVHVFDKLSEFMSENYGNAWTKYEIRLRKAFGTSGNVAAFDKVLRGLSKNKPTLSIKKMNEAQATLLRDIEKSGYQIGYAPKGKVISQASNVVGDESRISPTSFDPANPTTSVAGIDWRAIEDGRSRLGTFLDNMGFSPKGTVEGANEFVYARSFTQHVMDDFRNKFGNTIVLNKPVRRVTSEGTSIGTTKVRIPVERLYEWLKNHRTEMFQNRTGLGRAQAYRPVSLSDLSIEDLKTIGFGEEEAKAISEISMRSLREIPASITGAGEKLVNVLRSADVGFARFGSFYDKYIKTTNYMRYQSALSFMFQAQQYLEAKIMASMVSNDLRLLPGAEAAGNFLNKKIVSRVFDRMKVPMQKITIEPSINDLAIARDILIPNTRRAIEDITLGNEATTLKKGIQTGDKARVIATESRAQVLNSTRVDAFWVQMWGGYASREAAKIGESFANKFGMTLEEATAHTIRDGKKVFANPRLVRDMQDAVQGVLHYKPGFQTSPLVKTLNIAVFPFRFQAKTLEVTGKWLGTLDPSARLVVVNNISTFANWAASAEGQRWIHTAQEDDSARKMAYSILAYTTAWAQIGDSITAVSRGQLFGGQAGLIGGIPFGFVMNFLTSMGVIPEDPNAVDPKTGRPFRAKKIPREFASEATAKTALEEFVYMMVPGMPLYTLTGGIFSGVGFRQLIQKGIDTAWPWAASGFSTGSDFERKKKELDRQMRPLHLGDTRF